MAVAGIDPSWVGKEFDLAEFNVKADEILAYSAGCGETDPRFSDPTHPEFQAPPTFTAKYVSRRILPEEFPHIGSRGFDAGKTVHVHGAVRPGDRLVARSRIADIYEKTGRTGSMVFIVHRMEFTNQDDRLVSVVDWRMVRQPDAE